MIAYPCQNSKQLHCATDEYTVIIIQMTMKIFFSILLNASILYAIAYLIPEVVALGGWQLYLIAGVILGVLNTFIKPILKVLGFPFIIITFGLFTLVINGVILLLLQKIITLLNIAGVSYQIDGWVNFAIAVVIFSIFNTIYGAFFKH
jgi:putative membrane protein